MSKQFLTPETLKQMVQNQLVVRTKIGGTSAGSSRRIILTATDVYSFERDIDGNPFYSKLLYGEETYADGEYISCLSLVGLSFSLISVADVASEYKMVLEHWSEKSMSLLLPDQVMVCSQISLDLIPSLVNPHSVEILQHYARLQTSIAYEMTLNNVEMKSILNGVFYRFSSFLRDLNRPWKLVTAKPEWV